MVKTNIPSDDVPSRSNRLDQVVADYLRALEGGENPSREELLTRHPDLAAELQEFFADHERMNRLAQPLYEATLAQPAIAAAERIRYFGDYEVLDEIARGGMGVVYKARQMTLNRIVAIKMILSGHLASSADVERFHTEAEAAAKLEHPGIVPIYEVGQHEGQHYFSMGFVDGQSLAKRVAEGPLEPRAAAEMVKTVSEAVQYAHDKGVIHRDLKPGNILLDKDGQPRVADFGLAKLTESVSDLTGTGQILGTPSYIPPEQAAGKIEQISPAADVYALGAILYCLLTGRPPFQAANPLETLLQVQKQDPVPPRHLNAGIPLDLNTIALKCLEKEPARRYQSAQEVAQELQRFLTGEPIVARPINVVERSWRWCKRRPLIPGVVATVLSIAIVGGLVFRHLAVIQRQQSLQREVVTAVDAAQANRGVAVPLTLKELQKLPREMVVADLNVRYANAKPQHKPGLAYARAAYDDVDVEYLCAQIQRAGADEVNNLVTALGMGREAALQTIALLAKKAAGEQEWRLKARLAIVALHLEDDRLAADMCRIAERPDPVQRTLFIDEVSMWHGNVAPLAVSCREVADAALRSGLCLGLGSVSSMSSDRLSDSEKEAWKSVCAEWYEAAPDNVTHSAAGWALRQWASELPALSATGQPSDGRQWFVNSLGMTLLKVQPGQFERIQDSKKYTVTLTRAFFLADREVSVAQFQKFLDDPGVLKMDKPADWRQGRGDVDREGDHSQRGVNWYDAVLFCNWLSRQEGLSPCYERTGNKEKFQIGTNNEIKRENDEWRLAPGGTGYRLPTEAEWEYACRAGTSTNFACGSDPELLRKYAVSFTRTTQGAFAGGSRLPNGWGLFDMHGNVGEWCNDWYGPDDVGAVNDPTGPTKGTDRVYRGGAGFVTSPSWSSGDRGGFQPHWPWIFNGFRPALSSVQPVK